MFLRPFYRKKGRENTNAFLLLFLRCWMRRKKKGGEGCRIGGRERRLFIPTFWRGTGGGGKSMIVRLMTWGGGRGKKEKGICSFDRKYGGGGNEKGKKDAGSRANWKKKREGGGASFLMGAEKEKRGNEVFTGSWKKGKRRKKGGG